MPYGGLLVRNDFPNGETRERRERLPDEPRLKATVSEVEHPCFKGEAGSAEGDMAPGG